MARRAEPKMSLGTAVLAAMLADVIWTMATMAGVEHASFRPGVRGAANYLVMAEVPWSHSLAMDVEHRAISSPDVPDDRARLLNY